MSEKPVSTTSYDPNTPFGRYIMRMLRRLFLYWPERAAVRKRSFSRKEGVLSYHLCEKCGKEVPRKESHVDHIIPVIPLTGPDDWGNIMKRLFVSRDEMQNLCKECHAIKTKQENATRYKHRSKARRRKAKG